MPFIQSPYEVLQLTPDMSKKDIKRQYKKRIRQFTPEHAPQKFMEIREAYNFLNNPKKTQTAPVYLKPLQIMREQNKLKANQQTQPKILAQEQLTILFETPFNTMQQLKDTLNENPIFQANE